MYGTCGCILRSLLFACPFMSFDVRPYFGCVGSLSVSTSRPRYRLELRHGRAVVISEQQRRQLWLEVHFSGCSAFQSRSSFCSFSFGVKLCRALRLNPTRATSATFGARAASSPSRRMTSVGRLQPIAANARNDCEEWRRRPRRPAPYLAKLYEHYFTIVAGYTFKGAQVGLA